MLSDVCTFPKERNNNYSKISHVFEKCSLHNDVSDISEHTASRFHNAKALSNNHYISPQKTFFVASLTQTVCRGIHHLNYKFLSG